MNKKPFLEKRSAVFLLLGVLAAAAIGAYLIGSNWILRIGFPLDDAWIHQTYARNLVTSGAWEFLPGQPSAGSTAPAWTLLLSVGYWLDINFYAWTFLLGWILLWTVGVTAAFGFKQLEPKYSRYGLFAGMLVIFEWHLTWAAGSGMETLLAGLLALVVLLGVIALCLQGEASGGPKGWKWFGLGALIGLSLWIRPDGITLLAAAGLAILFRKVAFPVKLRNGLWLLAGVLVVATPYLIFNLYLAGDFWPNTFYAKQTEYASLREAPLWQRYLDIIRQPLTGVGILLLPGFLWYGYRKAADKSWGEVAAFLWVIGYVLVYALRLPVTYQHGRYIMPVMPAFCLLGLAGLFELLEVIAGWNWGRIIRPAWLISALIVLGVFWVLGLRGYAMDVAVIESEMVTTAHWVAENTEPASLIGAHDIGALGYFGNRELVDLAGLVSPEVIPFIRDESRLGNYLDEQAADYLVTFPGWYPDLVARSALVYQTNQQFSTGMGGENMAVYRWDEQ
jgi:hypothetical protein